MRREHFFPSLPCDIFISKNVARSQAVMRHTSSKMLLETYAKAGALVIKEGLRNFKI